MDQNQYQLQDWVADALHKLLRNSSDGPNGRSDLRAVIEKPRPEMTGRCRLMLEILGLDPQTATVEELDELDPIFECLMCNDPEKGRFVMAWESTVCSSPFWQAA